MPPPRRRNSCISVRVILFPDMPKGMTDSDCTTVDINQLVRYTELGHCAEADRRESFIDLIERNVPHIDPRTRSGLGNGT